MVFASANEQKTKNSSFELLFFFLLRLPYILLQYGNPHKFPARRKIFLFFYRTYSQVGNSLSVPLSLISLERHAEKQLLRSYQKYWLFLELKKSIFSRAELKLHQRTFPLPKLRQLESLLQPIFAGEKLLAQLIATCNMAARIEDELHTGNRQTITHMTFYLAPQSGVCPSNYQAMSLSLT